MKGAVGERKLLLHICCAPDATVPWRALVDEGFDVVGYFYGSNIHPADEYDKRREAVEKLAREMAGSVIFAPYEPEIWMDKVRHLAGEPEGGKRCTLCFALQLKSALAEALKRQCDAMATSLTISPHKDPNRINALGHALCRPTGVEWVDRIWRKRGGFALSVKESLRLGLYRQRYCGCIYSIPRKEG